MLLVERGHVELGPEELELLVERTEGWPAALVLAGLWLRAVEDPGSAVRDFGGDQRFVADYLSREVFASLGDEQRSFLQAASVLGRFTSELCDDVLDRSDSAAILAELARTNMLILPLERGGWFRVHSLFAEYAVAELASLDPAAGTRIHRRAAGWLRSQGLPTEATEHAAAAGDDELVAELLVEYHLPLIRSGATRTLLRRVRALPEERLVEHPELAAAAATAALMAGQSTMELRRFLSLVDRARAGRPEGSNRYADAAARMVRALTMDGGVRQAVVDGGGAVELAQAGEDELVTAALTGQARALYFAGDLDDAWRAALRVLAHPDARRRVPSQALARVTLALVAVERGQLFSARHHAERAKEIIGGIGTSRSWLGANASAALGAVLAAEGKLADAERELTLAEHFFEDEVATVHHAWLRVLLAGVRVRRGRLDEAESTLRGREEELEELTDGGRIPALADEVERELEAASPAPATGSCSSRRPRPSSRCSGCLPPTSRRGRSANSSSSRPTRSAPTSVRSTASSASTPVQTPSLVPVRSASWGKRNHPGDSLASPVNDAPDVSPWGACPLASIGWSSRASRATPWRLHSTVWPSSARTAAPC